MEEYRSHEEILKLFETLGIEYLPRPRIAWAPLESMIPEKTGYYLDNREEFEKLNGLYSAPIRAGEHAPVFITRTGEMGYGLFADEDIRKAAFIGEYSGIIDRATDFILPEDDEDVESEPEESRSFPTDYAWGFPDCIEDTPLEINAAFAGNELRFVNHSFRPNLLVEHTVVDGRWAVFFIARKRIRKGDQLFVDYGIDYWAGGHRELIVE